MLRGTERCTQNTISGPPRHVMIAEPLNSVRVASPGQQLSTPGASTLCLIMRGRVPPTCSAVEFSGVEWSFVCG